MTLRNRFLLVGLGLVLFVVITPAFVLYALGYKVNWRSGQVVKTGSFVVKSEPAKADVLIDDDLQKTKTNSTVRFLLPGDYNLEIAKAGYQPWTKRLNVRSGIVTWANQDRDFVTLFYDHPKFRDEKAFSLASISQKENHAIFVQDGKVFGYSADRTSFQQIDVPSSVFSNPSGLGDSESKYYLYRYPATRLFTAAQLSTARHIEGNDAFAVATVGREMLLAKSPVPVSLAQNVSGFTLENDNLWYVESNLLKRMSLNTGVVDTVAELPYSPVNAKIIRGNSRIFMVLDGTLYELNEKVDEIYRGVTYASWSDESKKLVFANNNEALVFDPNDFRTELIIRSSSAIRQPVLNKQTGYLFFINEEKVKAIEMDGRDHRNVYTIYSEPTKAFLLNDEGKTLSVFSDTRMQVVQIRE